MTTLQEFLNKKYPTQKAKEPVKEIIIGGFLSDTIPEEQSTKLIGNQLNLTEYPNLEKVEIWGDHLKFPLTELNLSGCANLEVLYCPSNQLSNLNFLNSLNPERLTRLNIKSNNITSDLNPLRRLVNLGKLNLENNPLSGSLEPLRGMAKLWWLDISNTNLDSGLEYLPESIKEFDCSIKEKKDAKCQALDDFLKNIPGKYFPQKLRDYKQWRKLNFTNEEIPQWVAAGFLLNDYETANQFKQNQPNILFEEIIKKAAWQDVHSGFNYSYRKGWEGKGVDYNEVKQWIDIGFKPSEYNLSNFQEWKKNGFDYEEIKRWRNAGAKIVGIDNQGFIIWLKDIKNYGSEWITNYKEDYQILSERFKKYGLCPECKEPNTGEQWCWPCNAQRLQENFPNWTSHNSQVDEFIQQHQLQATDADKFIEWIPYEQLTNIEYLAEGGFGKVYRAEWTIGNIRHWNRENNQWQREKDYCYKDKDGKEYNHHRAVVLKSLTNSQNNTDFLQEIEKHKIIDDWFNNIVPCYGLSQDPETGNYLMVMQYLPERDLRHYLKNKNKELTLQDKLSQLLHIAQGLKDIHAKNLVHRDFHSGNILKGVEKTSCLITDLGLCKPVNEVTKEEKIYGVMPYVAPEVLLRKPYTQASDVYSFGIVAYEILSGLPPYYDKAHDVSLALEICGEKNLRPQFQIKIPQLLEDLICKCWDADPQNRPTSSELEKTLRKWQDEFNRYYYESTEFKNQLQAAEEYNKALPEETKFPKYQIHHGASYHSKVLPTKEITKLLQNSQLIPQQSKSSELISKQLIKINKLVEEIKQNPSNSKKTTSELTIYFLGKSKELTKELKEILAANPNISEEGKKALKKIKELKDESRKKIDKLLQEIQSLTQSAYQKHLPNNELLSQMIKLIKIKFELTEAEKRKEKKISKLSDEYYALRQEIKVKLNEEAMNDLDFILSECAELVRAKLELEEWTDKKLAIGISFREQSKKITYSLVEEARPSQTVYQDCTIYNGDINAGNHASFNKTGVQNNAPVTNQHNYPSEAKIQQNNPPPHKIN